MTDIPAVEISQWKAGRILSAADVAMLHRMMRMHEEELGEQVDNFAAGREQALRELGGQEFVDLDAKSMEIDAKLAWKRACIKVGEKEAELAKLNQ